MGTVQAMSETSRLAAEDAAEVRLSEESLEGAVDAGGDVLHVRDELGVDDETWPAPGPGQGFVLRLAFEDPVDEFAAVGLDHGSLL